MKLIPIEDRSDAAHILWDLLAERPSAANISHREMPTWTAHEAFCKAHGYRTWRLIETPHGIVGAIYLTMQNEIGIGIFSWAQGKGYGPAAIKMLMEEYGPRVYLANISPRNPASRRMFEKMGFAHIQDTFALETGNRLTWPTVQMTAKEVLELYGKP